MAHGDRELAHRAPVLRAAEEWHHAAVDRFDGEAVEQRAARVRAFLRKGLREFARLDARARAAHRRLERVDVARPRVAVHRPRGGRVHVEVRAGGPGEEVREGEAVGLRLRVGGALRRSDLRHATD